MASSSSSYKQFEHLPIPIADIACATDNFSDANLIREGRFGKHYKGKLNHLGKLIDIVARRLDPKNEYGYLEFWMEVTMLSTLKHDNLVSMIGFCDDNDVNIVVNKHEAKGSLDQYLSDPITLTWTRRLEVCVGMANTLRYIHYDPKRNFSVVHRDIKSSKILLDDKWKPKLSGFELAMKIAASQRGEVHSDYACGTRGYIDPIYMETGRVSHKSDVYSFGVVLFEIMCGTTALITSDLVKKVLEKLDHGSLEVEAKLDDERSSPPPTSRPGRQYTHSSNLLLSSSSSFNHYYDAHRKLQGMIDPDLWKQMGPKSFQAFSEIAYYCLKESQSERPDIHQVCIKLKKALDHQRKYENPEQSHQGTSTSRTMGEKLKHLEIPLSEIILATENFAEKNRIGGGTYGDVYIAQLYHFDSKYYKLPLEKKNIGEFPKKRSTVAVKHIKFREDKFGEEGFLGEIEMLTNCKHPNIISLLGFCEEDHHMILVYEHASNGGLEDYLGSDGSLTNLSWLQRIKICIDIACGLNYLHTKLDGEQRIIHRDIKSGNILLGRNWEAKIADFGLSKFRHEDQDQQANKTLYTTTLAGTELYMDPEYYKTGKLKNETDIYSFGVVLFELMAGKFANDPIFTNENSNGIVHVARRRFREEIAYQCVAISQAERPTAEVIIKKLKKALYFQENIKDNLEISLKDIQSATDNLSDDNVIGKERFGSVYKGEVTNANGLPTYIAAKRWDRTMKGGQDATFFEAECRILSKYKHENIIGLVGYCNEMDEKIIVYEHAPRGSLNMHLANVFLTWRKRLEICIDIANGLFFLHGGGGVPVTQVVVMHRDIKSGNVLLMEDWKAKISDFGISLITPISDEVDFVVDEAWGTIGYVDPLYFEHGFLTKESDIYSFGVVLLEILFGRLQPKSTVDSLPLLTDLFKRHYEELGEVIFEGIKEQVAPNSLTMFQKIAYRCLHEEKDQRPTTGEVLLLLKKALEFQDDYDVWKPKLPKDFEKLIQMSNSPEIYSEEKYEHLYYMFSKGILIQEGKVSVMFGINEERNVMISAHSFSYINHCLHKRQHIPESRFQGVVEMLDILNLNIKINTRTQLLSPNAVYGVYFVFKFCDPIKYSSKPLYVNLKYKNGSETSHAYFATWRDDEWMMIELWRFLNDKEDIVFEFLLESFSQSYYEDSTIYVEGIEFRDITNASFKLLYILLPFHIHSLYFGTTKYMDNLKYEEIFESEKSQQILGSHTNTDLLQQSPTNHGQIFERFEHDDSGEKVFWLPEVDGKKHFMLSAKTTLNNYGNAELFKTTSSAQSRFQEVVELLPQQAFRINCMIESQMLSKDTNYVCYLVFKISDKCHGLRYPVKVRDLLQWYDKETLVIYFRSPSPWNLHDTDQAGWMEVKVWKFNLNHAFEDDHFYVNLRLYSFEGTMSGLIVDGLEFRPM
ncbi:hypothetical protein LXL04_021904 [Taraxacum kok-saghyz]